MAAMSDYERFKRGMATEAEDRYLPMSDIYMTDHGPVSISPAEAALLKRDDDIRRKGHCGLLSLTLSSRDVAARANLLRVAINRVAEWKASR